VSALLVAQFFAVAAPFFIRNPRIMLRALALQGFLLAAMVLIQHRASADLDTGSALLLADLVLVRGVFAPLYLRRTAARGVEELELLPGNLLHWSLAVALVVAAFWFGATIPPAEPLPSAHLGVALSAILLGLLGLSLSARPLAQVIAAVTIENGVVLVELLLNHHFEVPLELGLSAVFVLSIVSFGWLSRHLQAQEV
jgi:hydrogenase-4 membrane subunit HyfE